MHDLSQFNKTQYYQIHLTAAISLSLLLDHENMTFSIFVTMLKVLSILFYQDIYFAY